MKKSKSFAVLLVVIVGLSLVISLVIFGFSVLYAINGSLESFPNAEQMEKARITAVLLAGAEFITSGILAAILLKLFKKLRNKRKK
jgi:predicted benzoate:H+ symporter BenE